MSRKKAASERPITSRLAGDVAVVTGGAQGIGKAIAHRLGAEGATVIVLDANADAGETTLKELEEAGVRAQFLVCNVASREEVRAALMQVTQRAGTPTLLVNNAGIGMRAAFLDVDDEQWDNVLSVNLTGTFIVAQETCRLMASAGIGSVVNMASVSAYLSHGGLTAYSVSKAGIVALTRMMAFELAPLGIRVNAVAPGTIATDFVSKMVSAKAQAERMERIPLGRFGTPAEVAATVAFLLSSDAHYITGSVIPIEGGLLVAGIRA